VAIDLRVRSVAHRTREAATHDLSGWLRALVVILAFATASCGERLMKVPWTPVPSEKSVLVAIVDVAAADEYAVEP
jgi:hypothetical protein